MAVTMKNAIFWDVAVCGFSTNPEDEATHASKTSFYNKPCNIPETAFFYHHTVYSLKTIT
jgi:hypothetical protein